MVVDNPRMSELERMAAFCRSHTYVFLYRTEPTQKLISKYLWMSKIKLQGFVKPEVYEGDRKNEPFPIYDFVDLCRFAEKNGRESVGVIISTEDEIYNQVIDTLRLLGVKDVFLVSEWNKRAIPKKMCPRSAKDFLLEVNIADHCNLNCQCCDHFSPLAPEVFLDIEQYQRDMRRLAYLAGGHIGLMKLQGGEPLLCENLLEYLRITRECFPDTYICIFTDGLLLAKWGDNNASKNIWKAIKEYECEIRLTQYPIALNLEKILEQAKQHGVAVYYDAPPYRKETRLWILTEIGISSYKGVKHSVKHPFDLEGKQDKYRWISCYQFNESIVLRDGKIFTCPMIPYAHYFNDAFGQKLEVKDDCYIDIYQASSFEEIAEFCTHRTSFCDYCAVHRRSVRAWKQSEHNMEEWVL